MKVLPLSSAKGARGSLPKPRYYWLYELHMFWFRRAFVESDFFAGVSMVLLMFCFFAKLSRAVEWCHSVFLIFFSQFIKSQNIAKHSTAAPCAAVFSLLDWHQLTRAGLRSKLVFILSFSTEKLCSDLCRFEITTSNNLFEIMWELRKNKKEWRNDDVRMQGYSRHTDILR